MPNTSYCKVWASTEEAHPLPSDTYLTIFVVMLAGSAFIVTVVVRTMRKKDMKKLLRDAGVAMHKVAKTAQEIERKLFHLAGLLVPLIYQVLLQYGWSQGACCRIVWAITLSGVSLDAMRVYIPFVQRNWPLRSILREQEQKQLCGGTYFSLGCSLTMHFFPPVIAMTSMIFLVLGDMSAALIGRSFGQSVVSMRIGPGGKKSVEGSAAMFLVCVVIGCVIFGEVHLREYAVVFGALTATITELYEPLGINDNVTIPILTGLALTFGFARTYSCEPARSPLLWSAL